MTTRATRATRATRVIVVDDHYVTRAGTIAILGRDARFAVVGEAADGKEAVRLCQALHPELVVLDTRLPGMDGPAVARALRMLAPPPRILMLSAYGDAASVRTALEAGASGYVLKSVAGADLLAAIERALRGEQVLLGVEDARDAVLTPLSPQEIVVLGYVAAGMTTKEIATKVYVSPRTVETYLARVFRKLEAQNRTDAVRRARQEGMLPEE